MKSLSALIKLAGRKYGSAQAGLRENMIRQNRSTVFSGKCLQTIRACAEDRKKGTIE